MPFMLLTSNTSNEMWVCSVSWSTNLCYQLDRDNIRHEEYLYYLNDFTCARLLLSTMLFLLFNQDPEY